MNKTTQSGLMAVALACLMSWSISQAADTGIAAEAS
ncbi:MAG: hypothetical protein ACI9BW_001548, partial [Gammaproteobacteria bacterium]